VLVSDGVTLPLSGTVNNTGTITLASTGDATKLLVTDVTLQGGGQVILSDNSHNIITGTDPSATLTNIDNTISGVGHLGNGQMTLVNDGTIIADGNNRLIIDTGANVITNFGTLQSTGAGGLVINGDLANSGLLWADGGNITVHGNVSGAGSAIIDGSAVIEVTGAESNSVTFHSATGELILDHSADFTGTIFGFTGDGTLTGSDLIDLRDISFSVLEQTSYADGVLTVSDGVHTAHLSFDGNYQLANFKLVDDGHGGTTVYDPPVNDSSTTITDSSTSVSSIEPADLNGTPSFDNLVDDFKAEFKGITQSFSDELKHILADHDGRYNSSASTISTTNSIADTKPQLGASGYTDNTSEQGQGGHHDGFLFAANFGHDLHSTTGSLNSSNDFVHFNHSDDGELYQLLQLAHDANPHAVAPTDPATLDPNHTADKIHDLFHQLLQHPNDFHFV
jgi:hypothetical protein